METEFEWVCRRIDHTGLLLMAARHKHKYHGNNRGSMGPVPVSGGPLKSKPSYIIVQQVLSPVTAILTADVTETTR